MILFDALRKLFSEGAVEDVTAKLIDKTEELEEQIKVLQVQAGKRVGEGAELAKETATEAYKTATQTAGEAHQAFRDTMDRVSDAVNPDEDEDS